MGGKNQTTTQNAVSTPTGLPQLYDIWNRVQQVASQPYTPYGGQMVASLSPTQQAGIAGVSGAQGAAQPYFDKAADYARTGASAIDPSSIQRYMSPYTQNVIDATRRNFDQDNAIQQNQVIGNAASRGALGGDRVGVAAAETARQQRLAQDPVIAGMYSSAYDKAMGAAQQDRAAAAQGAYTFGALAPSVQNAKISGAQAQIGAGGLEQGTEQAKLTAAYNQYLQQLAFPYQQAGFLAQAGLPAAAQMGGQTAGTTTKPGPSPWGQIAGLGLTAAMMASRGGRINRRTRFAEGGPVGFLDVPTYVPRFGGVSVQSPFGSAPGLPKIPDDVRSQMPSNQQMAAGAKGIKSLFGGMGGQAEGGNYDLNMAGDGVMTPAGFLGGGVKRGGRINARMARFHDTVHAIRHTLRGGRIRGYADGGDVIDLSPSEYVNRGFLDTRDAIDGGAFDPQGSNAPGPMAFSPPTAPAAPMPIPRPAGAPQTPYSLPPQIAQGPDGEELPPDAMAFDAPQRSPYALPALQAADTAAPAPDAPAKSTRGLFGNPFGLSDDARMGLMSAGLGMMASQSPFLLSAVGEGGQAGVKTYQERLNQRQKIDSEAKRLAQTASQFAQNLGLHKAQLSETSRHNIAGEQRAVDLLAETRRQRDLQEMQPIKIGTDALGREIYGIRDPKTQTIKIIDPKTGRVVEPAAAKPLGPLSQNEDDAAIPANAQLVSGEGTRNEEFLKSLAEADQNLPSMIKKIADYEINPSSLSTRGGHRERILGMVSRYDPEYNQAFYPARAQALKEFIGGGSTSPAAQMTAGNTAIQHAGDMSDAAEKMKKIPGVLSSVRNAGIPFVSYAAAQLQNKSVRGTPEGQALADFMTARNHFSEEVTKFYAGSQGSEAERKRALDNLDEAKSVEELRAAIATEAKLMSGKVNALQERWKNAMGGVGGWQSALKRANIPDFPIIQKKSEEAMKRLNERAESSRGSTHTPEGPKRVRQNGHTYEQQSDGTYKAVD